MALGLNVRTSIDVSTLFVALFTVLVIGCGTPLSLDKVSTEMIVGSWRGSAGPRDDQTTIELLIDKKGGCSYGIVGRWRTPSGITRETQMKNNACTFEKVKPEEYDKHQRAHFIAELNGTILLRYRSKGQLILWRDVEPDRIFRLQRK